MARISNKQKVSFFILLALIFTAPCCFAVIDSNVYLGSIVLNNNRGGFYGDFDLGVRYNERCGIGIRTGIQYNEDTLVIPAMLGTYIMLFPKTDPFNIIACAYNGYARATSAQNGVNAYVADADAGLELKVNVLREKSTKFSGTYVTNSINDIGLVILGAHAGYRLLSAEVYDGERYVPMSGLKFGANIRLEFK